MHEDTHSLVIRNYSELFIIGKSGGGVQSWLLSWIRLPGLSDVK